MQIYKRVRLYTQVAVQSSLRSDRTATATAQAATPTYAAFCTLLPPVGQHRTLRKRSFQRLRFSKNFRRLRRTENPCKISALERRIRGSRSQQLKIKKI